MQTLGKMITGANESLSSLDALLGESEDFIFRLLQLEDYEKGYLACSKQLRDTTGYVSFDQWKSCFKKTPKNNFTIIVESKNTSKIAASATLIVQQRGFAALDDACQFVGHVEDMVVLTSFRNQGLGPKLLDLVKDLAHKQRCYKIQLTCKKEDIGFFENCDFIESCVCMKHYFWKAEEKIKEKKNENLKTFACIDCQNLFIQCNDFSSLLKLDPEYDEGYQCDVCEKNKFPMLHCKKCDADYCFNCGVNKKSIVTNHLIKEKKTKKKKVKIKQRGGVKVKKEQKQKQLLQQQHQELDDEKLEEVEKRRCTACTNGMEYYIDLQSAILFDQEYEDGYQCDDCTNKDSFPLFHCETCNIDLCKNCAPTRTITVKNKTNHQKNKKKETKNNQKSKKNSTTSKKYNRTKIEIEALPVHEISKKELEEKEEESDQKIDDLEKEKEEAKYVVGHEMETNWTWLASIISLIALFGILLFVNSLNVLPPEFVFDDSMIEESPDIMGERPLIDLFYHDYWGMEMSAQQASKSWRPFTVYTFRLNWLFSEKEPFSYHIFNIVSHGLVSSLISLVTHLIFYNIHITCITGLLFASHPIHVEAVANLVGRAELLCTFFACLYIIFTLFSSRTKNISFIIVCELCSNVCLALSILSKEQGTMFIAFMIGLEIFQPKLIYRENKRNNIFCAAKLIVQISTVLSLIGLRYHVSGGNMIMTVPWIDNPYSRLDSPFQRMISYMFLHSYSFYLLCFPYSLCADYSFNSIPELSGIGDYRFKYVLLFYGGLILSCVYSLYLTLINSKSRLNSYFQFCWGLIIATFLPCTNLFFTVGFVIADRTLYIPSIGFCILMAYTLCKFKKSFKTSWGMVYAVVFSIVGYYSARTMARNLDWKSEYDLWHQDAQGCASGSAKAVNNYAWRLMNDKQDYESAVEFSWKAIRIECKLYEIKDCTRNLDSKRTGHLNLRDALRLQAIEYAKKEQMNLAIKNFKTLTQITPHYMMGWQFWVKAAHQLGKHKMIPKIQRNCKKANPTKKRECEKRL